MRRPTWCGFVAEARALAGVAGAGGGGRPGGVAHHVRAGRQQAVARADSGLVAGVRRYQPEGGVDGLPGGEGAFLACSFWLADALHGIGRTGEARALFQRLIELRNDVGLLSEEYDLDAGRQVGKHPRRSWVR
ncbi:glycoside hydrolase family 15 protein [Goodfellowiella coeruleoviolacea]|uniref:glycoside hydrolase family 15 protein n=1 Tax=Goodfellowiella coeruleoviolacea TaxID=334858 RepID=UPI0020A2D606|nr:glycoside hydrolase family 15 protein [Goodfellowiella coeruleoviolacea]